MDIQQVQDSIEDDEQVRDSIEGDQRRLFVFVKRSSGRYALYMIDTIRLLGKTIAEEALSPLIFFRRRVLPICPCAFAFIEPNFYVVGENVDEFYSFNKNSILNLKLAEKRRGSEFLIHHTNTPMNFPKSEPLAFSYKGNLYVISKRGSPKPKLFNSFEFYSPSTATWTDLWPKPMWESSIQAHVIHQDMVYFSLSSQTIMSFNFEISRWSTVYDPYGQLYIHKDMFSRYSDPIPPTFDSQIEIFGDLFFGGVLRDQRLDIYASEKFHPYEKLFLRPTLAPTQRFCNLLDTEATPSTSKYIVKMDGIMCVLCYTDLPSSDYSSQIVLNFFNVSDDPHQLHSSSSSSNAPVAQVPTRDGQDVNYFNAELLSRTLLPINTLKKPIHGTLCTCLFV